MSSLTYAEAEDSILGMLKTAWQTAYPTAPLLYRGVTVDTPTTGLWAKASVLWGQGGQGSLSGRLWDRTGIVLLQLFNDADGSRALTTAAQVLVDAMEGRAIGSIWFTDVTPKIRQPDGAWSRMDVTASFEFQQIKAI